jgi:nitrite reductase (NADH) small subunit
MTRAPSLNTAPAEPADTDGSGVTTTGPSPDAAAEPADADGLGEAAVDDPADADADAGQVMASAGTGRTAEEDADEWVRLCRLDQLTPDRGRAALVGGQQVAVFRLSARPSDSPPEAVGDPVVGGDQALSEHVYAVGNRDPFSGAHVLARGIVGDKGGVPKVASPVFKQSFDLRTGECLDDPEVTVPAYRVRVEDGWILVELSQGSP